MTWNYPVPRSSTTQSRSSTNGHANGVSFLHSALASASHRDGAESGRDRPEYNLGGPNARSSRWTLLFSANVAQQAAAARTRRGNSKRRERRSSASGGTPGRRCPVPGSRVSIQAAYNDGPVACDDREKRALSVLHDGLPIGPPIRCCSARRSQWTAREAKCERPAAPKRHPSTS